MKHHQPGRRDIDGEASRPPLSVVFVAHGPGQINGPNVWLTRLLPALIARGIAPRVLMFMVRDGVCPIAEKLRAAGVPVETLPIAHTEDMVREIIRRIQEKPCDVFVPNLDVPAYFASRFLRVAGIPTIGVLHSDDDFHRDLIDEFIRGRQGRHLSAAVVVSAFQHDELMAIDHGSTRIVHAPYGAPLPTGTARFAAKPFRFLYVGRLVEEQKRISDTMSALIALLHRQQSAEFHLCGDGPARPALEKLIKNSGVDSRIKLWGNLPSNEVEKMLLQSQSLVLLSDYEGIPIALMEAMAAGVVPICTKIRSGVGDIVRHEENGLIVADRSESFISAAERLINDEALWARCSASARATVERSFSVSANADTWAEMLRELCSSSSKPVIRLEVPLHLDLPPVRANPKGMAREDRRKPVSPLSPMSSATPHPFTNPAFEINNIDLYWVRSSILRALQNALPHFHGTFLDIGCGVMPYREMLMRPPSRVSRYIGLDLNSEIYNAAVDLRWDGRTIPMGNASVDCAMATEVLEHCPEPLVVLKEARRVLKPGGIFFFTVPYIWPLHDAPYDFFRYTPFALEKLLADAGFVDVKVQAMGGWNASLAQMMGLWLKRAPMGQEARNRMAKQIWPMYQELIKTDQLPVDPKAGNTMTTGWTGLAIVPCVVEKSSEKVEQGDLPVVLVRSHEFNYSETFVEDHVNHLTKNLTLVYGFPFPRFVKGGRSVLTDAFEQKLKLTLSGGGTLPPELWQEYSEGLAAFFKTCGAKSALIETGLMGAFVHRACEQAGLPYVVHFHGMDAYAHEMLSRWKQHYHAFFKTASALIVVSEAMKTQLISLGAPAERVVLGPYGVSVDLERLAEPAKAAAQFIAVGRFVEKKAPQLTLQAFAAVHREVSSARLVMIGDGPLLGSCQQWAKDNGIGDAVTFAGVQSREEVSRRMVASGVFVQHSITASSGDSEGLPLAVLEAGAHGLPVIATRHAGIPDAVRDGVDGLLIAEKDVKGMAAAMLRLARDPILAANFGVSLRARIQARFARQQSLNRLLAVLQAAAESKASKQSPPIVNVSVRNHAPARTVPCALTGPQQLIAEDRNNRAAYLEIGQSFMKSGALADAYRAIGEAHRLGGESAETRELLDTLEEQGALGEPAVETYRRRAGWLARRKSAKPKRILVVTNLLPPQEMGGYGRTMWEFSRELQARGHTVRVYTADMPHLLRKASAEHEAFEVSVRRVLRLYGDWKGGAAVAEPDINKRRQIVTSNHHAVLAAMTEFRPEVVMVGNLDFVGHQFVQEILNQGIPVLHRLGNAHPGYEAKNAPESPLYCIAGCSEWVNDNVRSNGYPVTRYAVLPPGSPLTEYFRAFPPQREKLRIAFASLLMPYKGAHVLVEALAYLKKLEIEFECTLAGDSTSPEYLEKLKSFAADQGFLEQLRFPGFLAKRELAALYARCNVLVFPSVFEEPFGKTQIEAMAAGLVVVSSGNGGARDIIRDGETGLFFKNSDARDLAEKLAGLHRNPSLAERIASAGQADAFRFTTGASVDRLETILQDLKIAADRARTAPASDAGTFDSPVAGVALSNK